MIQIAGYETLLEDTVYAKKIGEARDEKSGRVIAINGILLPRTFTEPTEDQVVKHLQETAQGVQSLSSLFLPKKVDYTVGKSTLEVAIMKLPIEIQQQLRTADKDYMTFVRNHTPAENKSPEDSLHYLQVRYGLLPATVLEQNETEWRKAGQDWFDQAFSHEPFRMARLGEKWKLELLLSYVGSNVELPNRSELEILLKHRTHGSRTLDINRTRYDVEAVRKVIDLLYQALPTPAQFSQLRDVSFEVLEEQSMHPVAALHRLAMRNAAMAAQRMGHLPEKKKPNKSIIN